jgi:hypothetical protein
MPAKSKGWIVTVIKAVKDPLAFAVLIVLLVDGTLGGLAAKGPNQMVALYGLFFFLAVTLIFVAYLAIFKSDLLPGKDQSDEGSAGFRAFSDKISGHWWEIVDSGQGTLSWVEVTRDPSTQMVKLNGRMYGPEGKLAATWESETTCIKLNERKVFYYWTGKHLVRANEKYEGIGEITFYESLNDANGTFSDANLADLKTATMKHFRFKRMTREEEECLKLGDEKSVSDLLRGKQHLVA